MKLVKINWVNDVTDDDPETMAALKAFVEDVYNRGANAGFYMGFAFATAIAVGGLTAYVVTKQIEKRKEKKYEAIIIE